MTPCTCHICHRRTSERSRLAWPDGVQRWVCAGECAVEERVRLVEWLGRDENDRLAGGRE